MKYILRNIFLLMILILLSGCKGQSDSKRRDVLDEMKIFVTKEENRSVSFTNKEAAYYFTQSHQTNHPEHAYFEGLNIAKKKMFSGYELFVAGDKLDNLDSRVWVYPYKLLRKHGSNVTEEMWMFDDKNIMEVSMEGADHPIGIRLKGDGVKYLGNDTATAWFSSMEGGRIIAVSPKNSYPVEVKNAIVKADPKSKGFFIAVGDSREEASALIHDVGTNLNTYKEQRQNRMRGLLEDNTYILSNSDSLNLALKWIVMTMDQLLTKQQGYGIYAGLPWFNEYWGRDEFIALPGATLVTGQFEWAKKILTSFAEFQETDENSEFYGRVPNIVNPENIDYHTTDGTPRFIIQLREYVKYSGDTSIIRELYPNVRYSIEGALKNRVDEKGFLLHEDNETWMDARRSSDLMPYSPRGSRANDIQALWYGQLNAGIYFARFMNDRVNEDKWRKIAEKVKSNFEKEYRGEGYKYLADRLDKNNRPDFKLRPNQLFALDLIDDEPFRWEATRICWEELVYPWGVASLDRHDPFFHPFHLQWENYHKDEAYHNGTVWLWNNGIAMQRMIEANQQETAYLLFKNMNRQALTMGVVGGMAENMDAYPHAGEKWPKLTGTYLQAWSNSEQLRIWYQYFLGIRPDMINNTLTLAPGIPEELTQLDYKFYVGKGFVEAKYSAENTKNYSYRFHNISALIVVDLFPYERQSIPVKDGDILKIEEKNSKLFITLINGKGDELKSITADRSIDRIHTGEQQEEIFKGTHFCEPLDRSNHPVLNKKYDQQGN